MIPVKMLALLGTMSLAVPTEPVHPGRSMGTGPGSPLPSANGQTRLYKVLSVNTNASPTVLAPGTYVTSPYKMIVEVPKPVDAAMIKPVPDPAEYALRQIQPPLQFDRR